MMRALFAGVSGLKVHQTKMDVIGNNIANVNTVGFKSSTANFSDAFYQTTQSATGANATTGAAGQNAMQIGLGANLASITARISETGGSQRTDNPLDIMINGDSFFIVNSGGTNYFTKAGAFGVDGAGTLCTSSGATVMGWPVDADTGNILQGAVAPLKVMSAENLYSAPEATTKAMVTGNIDMKSAQVAPSGAGNDITVSFYDNLGNSYTAVYNVKQSATATNEYEVALKDIKDVNSQSIFSKYNATASPPKYELVTGVTATFGADSYPGTATVDPTTGAVTLAKPATPTKLTFDAVTGKFKQIGATANATSVNLKITATPNPFSTTGVDIDFSTTTMMENSGSVTLQSNKGDASGAGMGRQMGNMKGLKVDGAGKIYGTYDNGDQRLLGQIAVTSFANPSGLEAVGNNMFAQTQNSGEFDGIGKDPTTGGGSLTTGVLEMSNVDLSSEFTSMITTQRGFQANSRIITTSDTLLEELINLKR